MSSSKKMKYITDNRLLKSGEGFPDILTISVLSELLEKDPNLVNKTDSKTGWTLLIRAVMNNNFQVAEYLLERNANPDTQNIYGETSLHLAVENGNHKIINLLLEKGANPNIQQLDGETPMHFAALKGDYKVIKLLHLYGANPRVLTFSNQYSSLDYAAERGHTKCIQVLRPLIEGGSSMSTNCHSNIGFQTSKNSDYRGRGDMMNVPPIYSVNNTARHNSSMLQKQEINSSFSIREGNAKGHHERHRSFQVGRDRRDFLDDYDGSEQNSFMNQMSNFENRLQNIKNKYLQAGNNMGNLGNISQISNDKMKLEEPGIYEIQTPSSNYISSNVENYRFSFQNNIDNIPQEQGGYKFSTHQLMDFSNKSSPENKDSCRDVKTFNVTNENEQNVRLITMKPIDDLTESYYENPEISRITYATNQVPHEDNIFNMPLQIRNQNYSYYLSKVNDSYWNDLETHFSKKPTIATEKFIDNSKPLAVFISSRNDIAGDVVEGSGFVIPLNPIEYENTFEYNNIIKHSTGEVKNIKYFSKATKDLRQMSLDTQTISEEIIIDINEDINTDKTKDPGTSPESGGEYYKEIHEFLKSIDMEFYYRPFIKNGFDDFNLLLEHMKGDLAIKDSNLKDIGINLPGHRAKILLKLEEEAKLLDYNLPGQVFYTSKYDINNINSLLKDVHVKKIYEWLSVLKLEKYTLNFVKNGYHTIDLLYCQIFSK
jgi:ankyrin repeat protein